MELDPFTKALNKVLATTETGDTIKIYGKEYMIAKAIQKDGSLQINKIPVDNKRNLLLMNENHQYCDIMSMADFHKKNPALKYYSGINQ
jgi:hypothetical protein